MLILGLPHSGRPPLAAGFGLLSASWGVVGDGYGSSGDTCGSWAVVAVFQLVAGYRLMGRQTSGRLDVDIEPRYLPGADADAVRVRVVGHGRLADVRPRVEWIHPGGRAPYQPRWLVPDLRAETVSLGEGDEEELLLGSLRDGRAPLFTPVVLGGTRPAGSVRLSENPILRIILRGVLDGNPAVVTRELDIAVLFAEARPSRRAAP